MQIHEDVFWKVTPQEKFDFDEYKLYKRYHVVVRISKYKLHIIMWIFFNNRIDKIS